MSPRLVVLAVLLGLAACATGPEDYRFVGSGQPTVSVGQAHAQCRAQADALPVTQTAATNPMFVAASQQDFIGHCMAAKGYQLR